MFRFKAPKPLHPLLFTAILALGLGAIVGAGGPARASQILVANQLAAPVAVTMDAQSIGSLPGNGGGRFLQLASGEHAIAIVTDDGSSISKVFQMDEAAGVLVKNDRFWCVFVVPQAPGSVYGALVMLPTENCKAVMNENPQ